MSKRKTIYVNPPLEKLADECKESNIGFSTRLGDIVERYDIIMRLTEVPEMSDIEKMILGEVILGSALSPTSIRFMHEAVMDAATGTEDDKLAFREKVKDWSPVERIAAIESLGI